MHNLSTHSLDAQKITAEGVGIRGLTLSQVSCDVCITDKELSLRSRVMKARKDSACGVMSVEDFNLTSNYAPELKPGFTWAFTASSYNEEGVEVKTIGVRAICIHCIFESSFHHAAMMKLQQYNVSNDNNADEEEGNDNNADIGGSNDNNNTSTENPNDVCIDMSADNTSTVAENKTGKTELEILREEVADLRKTVSSLSEFITQFADRGK